MSLLVATECSEDIYSTINNGLIHSVFDRSCNVKTQTGELFTLVTPDIFYGPKQIRMSTEDFKELNLLVGQKVFLNQEGNLQFNTNSVNFESSPVFSLEIIHFPDDLPINLLENINHSHDYLLSHLDTVGFYRKTFPNDMEKIVHQWLTEKSNHLIEYMLTENWHLMFKEISALVGLGHGLTPSGDDVLTGLSLVINTQSFPNHVIQERFNEVVSELKEGTNFVSQNQLQLSLEGKSLLPILNVLSAFYEGKSLEEIIGLMKVVLTIGSSSGSDILAGILIGLRMVVI
ncbi:MULTISPECIES: DUF2877 domain-containing protein [Vagococcus]|uniref:oxamate carbamoyltransferase subunit AllH family protein n=1 Tax=Vagococcus TaxID=2737 RepID=UPI002FCC7D85